MKVKNIFHGMKKKGRGQKVLKQARSEESTIHCNSTDDPLESSTLTLSMEEEQQQLPREFQLKKYSESIDGSAMAAFARMSSTIADNLTEKEFGKQKNNFYRPNTNSYSSKVVHPVVCKRDIFVESVTPTKPKDRRSKKVSIYHVNDKESYLDSGKLNGNGKGETKEKKTKRRILLPDIEKIENERNVEPVRALSQTGKTDLQLFFTNDGKGTNNDVRSSNSSSNLGPYSVSASMLFRERKKLSIETGRTGRAERKKLSIETGTGRISTDESQMHPINPHRLHNYADENYLKLTKEWTKFPTKFAAGNVNVSPSSTVSSLTIPAELEFDPTPRALFHLHQSQMKNSPQLENIREDIQEISENLNDVIASRNNASERDRLRNEI